MAWKRARPWVEARVEEDFRLQIVDCRFEVPQGWPGLRYSEAPAVASDSLEYPAFAGDPGFRSTLAPATPFLFFFKSAICNLKSAITSASVCPSMSCIA